MGGTKISMTFAMKSVAPELPYLEQDSPTEDAAASFFGGFLPKSVIRKKIHSQPGSY